MKEKIKVPPISNEEEAEIQRQIAEDPDDEDISDEALAHPMTLAEAMQRRGRGPGKKPAKKLISLRLDPDVIEAYQAEGPGWQVRMNDALRKAKKLPPAA